MRTPGGGMYPRVLSSVEMTETTTLPVGSAVEPAMPSIGAGARASQGAPTKVSLLSAMRATMSSIAGGATSVTRSACTSRMFGVPMTAVGVRSGTR